MGCCLDEGSFRGAANAPSPHRSRLFCLSCLLLSLSSAYVGKASACTGIGEYKTQPSFSCCHSCSASGHEELRFGNWFFCKFTSRFCNPISFAPASRGVLALQPQAFHLGNARKRAPFIDAQTLPGPQFQVFLSFFGMLVLQNQHLENNPPATYIYIYAYGCLKEPHFRHFMRA